MISFIAYLLTLLALLIGVHFHFTLCQLLIIINGLPLIWHAFCFFALMRKIPWARFSLYFVKLLALKRVAQSSVPLLLIQMIQIITSQMIPILIASVTTLKDVADFGILWKMYLFISLVTTNVSLAHNPGFRDAYERGEIEWIKRALKRLAFFQGGLTLLGCLPLCIAGNKVVEVWINMPLEQPLKSSSWMLFTLCALFSVLNATLHSVLLILDKMRFQIVLIFFSSTALLLGILFGVSRIGLIAPFAAMGTAALLCMCFSFKSLKSLLNQKGINVFFQ
jgi:O-antigen/teichoic acid export membrane protein